MSFRTSCPIHIRHTLHEIRYSLFDTRYPPVPLTPIHCARSFTSYTPPHVPHTAIGKYCPPSANPLPGRRPGLFSPRHPAGRSGVAAPWACPRKEHFMVSPGSFTAGVAHARNALSFLPKHRIQFLLHQPLSEPLCRKSCGMSTQALKSRPRLWYYSPRCVQEYRS